MSSTQILSRMQIIAPYTQWVRSFSMTNGLENIPVVARQLGLKVAANAWISTNAAQNAIEVQNLIDAANSGLVDIAIVGSEAILRNDVTENQLIGYINQVRAAIPASIPVATADVWGVFGAHPNLISAVDVVFVNLYPYWEGTSIDNALCSLAQEYQQTVQRAGSKPVIISETGWPSAGDTIGAAVPSVANASLFALQFLTWAKNNNVGSFYFEGFNEAWKAAVEGPSGANWGLWDASGAMKPGMDAYFNGQTASVDCARCIAGTTGIAFVYVPPYGSGDQLEVSVSGICPDKYVLATYIKVFGGWWTKPTYAQPTEPINPDGSARIPINTGGSDTSATDIAIYLIPAGSTPPQAGGGSLPIPSDAIASAQAHRTPSSISGTITDSQLHPISGATISDPVLGTAISAPDGKYSFPNITTTGTATLTVTFAGYSFASSPATVNITAGNQPVNFTGGIAPNVTTSSLPDGTTGAVYNVSLSAASGAPPYGPWSIAGGALPPGLTLNGPSGVIAGRPTATAGSPYSFDVVVHDSAGDPSPARTLTIAVLAGAGTTTTLTSSANPAPLGQPVTLTASISAAPSSGTVTFYDGTAILGIRTVSAGKAILTTPLLPSGVRSLKALYSGDHANSGSISALYSQSVVASPVTGYQPTVSYPTNGTYPVSVVVDDFNGDGIPDIAAANSNSNDVSVLLGTRQGVFAAPAKLRADTFPQQIASADFNGDGWPDLVAVNLNGSTISVFPGKGDGTFQARIDVPVAGARAVAVSDFNGDGIADLVVENGSSMATILLGKGDGTFQNPANYGPAIMAVSVAVADLDGDGKADVVAPNYLDGSINVLMGNGDGTFTIAGKYTAGTQPHGIVLADFNGDGRPDIAVANDGSDNITVLLAANGGGFQPGVNYPVQQSPYSIAAGDFNGDGKVDLASVGWSNSGSILFGDGAGAFQTTSISPMASSYSLTVADLNGDGRTDLIVANSYDTVDILLGISPSLSIAKSHIDPFMQGQINALFTLNIKNAAGATQTNGPISVSEFLPDGLTLVSMDGGGWDCPIDAVNCTRKDPLPAGQSYPPITVTTKVAGNASAQLTNRATVSGGGSAAALAEDIVSILPFSCDLNGDRSTDVTDIQLLVNEALGVVRATHDLNHDGVVNVDDVLKATHSAMGLGCPY